jgi:hypothetical protein
MTTGTISIFIMGDTSVEGIEVFGIELTSVTGGAEVIPFAAEAQGHILDNEGVGPAPPQLVINDVAVVEGDSGTKNAVFTVTLSAITPDTVTVDYATANGSATAGTDYVATSGTLIFASGTTTQTITVPVLGDTVGEVAHESFFVNLTNGTVPIGISFATGTIAENDGFATLPQVTIDDISVVEEESSKLVFFTVALSAPTSSGVTVDFQTVELGLGSGFAVSGEDFVANSGSVFIPAGTTTRSITIAIRGDTTFEGDEVFGIELTGVTNAEPGVMRAQGHILDNEGVGPAPPQLVINDVAVVEGDSGTKNAVFTATLSAVTPDTVTVDYATANGSATAGTDYVATSGSLTFAPGTTTQTIIVPVLGDTVGEANELFFVNLTNGTVGIGIPQAAGLIVEEE